MKKREKISALLLACLLIFGTTACGSKPDQTTQSPSGAAETTVSRETEESRETTESLTEASYEEKQTESAGVGETTQATVSEPEKDAAYAPYAEILDKYAEALRDQWNMDRLLDEGMSLLCSYCYEGDALKNVGFALLDVDGDNSPELLIGTVSDDEFVDQMLFDMYTLKDGAPVQVFSGQERSRYYISEDEAGGYFITNEASMGAAQSATYYYTLDGGELKVVQAIVYDSSADAGNPWYMADDEDWDVSNDTPVDESMAESILESFEVGRFVPEYTAFADYR